MGIIGFQSLGHFDVLGFRALGLRVASSACLLLKLYVVGIGGSRHKPEKSTTIRAAAAAATTTT